MSMDHRTDEHLIDAYRLGERAALSELARRYELSLLGLARGLLDGREQDACDAVQETWLRIVRYAGSFNGRSRFKTWLYRIAINQCRTLWTARSEVAAALENDPNTADATATPARTTEDAEYAERVRRAVADLSAEQRAVVLLCYHGGMTHEEAGEILEIPVGTLKSRLHAALEELRTRLKTETNHVGRA